MREPGMETLQHYRMIPLYVMVKFGQWDELLETEKPDDDLIYPVAIWHYAQGMAHAGKEQLTEAKTHLDRLNVIQQDTMLSQITVWEINSVDQLVNIASRVLEAEIARQQEDTGSAITLLEGSRCLGRSTELQRATGLVFSNSPLAGRGATRSQAVRRRGSRLPGRPAFLSQQWLGAQRTIPQSGGAR